MNLDFLIAQSERRLKLLLDFVRITIVPQLINKWQAIDPRTMTMDKS